MRLIDADLLTRMMEREWNENEISNREWIHYRVILESIPTIDAVEVVRCKDCFHYESDGGAMMTCNVTDTVCDNDDYCSYGERKEGE